MKNYLALAIFLSGLLVANAADTVDTVFTNGLSEPFAVTVDSANNYFLTEGARNRILSYSNNFNLGILAGDGVWGTNDGFGLRARFASPQGIAYARGGLFVADSGNNLIRFINGATVSTLAGSLTAAPGSADDVGRAATFHSPAGLAADADGNIYIADQLNNSIRKLDLTNRVTTLAMGFFATNTDYTLRFSRPSAVAVDDQGQVFVADTGNNCIKVIHTNGVVELVAGSNTRSAVGFEDGYGTNVTFNAPAGVLWVRDSNMLLVSDTGNQVLRKVVYNAVYEVWEVTTFVSQNANIQKPMGLAQDTFGSFLIVDMGFGTDGGRLLIIPSTQATQSPVALPIIGVIDRLPYTNTLGDVTFVNNLSPIANATYMNEVTVGIISEQGTQTYYTLNGSDPSIQNGFTATDYQNGSEAAYQSIIPAYTNRSASTILIKAIGTASGRRPSAITNAQINFVVATPTPPSSENMNNFFVTSLTTKADLFYTTDGSDPSTNSTPYETGTVLSVFDGTSSNVVFKIRGFKQGYAASGIMEHKFLFSNLKISTIGINQNYLAGSGSTIVVPVNINVAAGDKFRSLQYRVEITAIGAGVPLPPSQFRTLDITPGVDFITVGGPAEPGKLAQGISYSYSVTNNNVLVGRGLAITAIGTNANVNVSENAVVSLLAVPIPPDATNGSKYSLSVLYPSGTSDAARNNVLLWSLADATITVSNLTYVVGDSAPSAWYNAGDFGDDNLLNNDVNDAFYASLGVRVPFSFSDVFDAMDSFPVDAEGVAGGDGQIRYLDWQTTLRRSLRLDPSNFIRYWTNSGRYATSTTLMNNNHPDLPALTVVPSVQAVIGAQPLTQVNPGQTVNVPVYVSVPGGASLSGLQLMAHVGAGNDAPVLTQAAEFVAAGTMPAVSRMSVVSSGVAAWDMGSLATPLRGSNLVGFVTFTVPTNALPGQAYTVYFTGVDGAADWNTQADFAVIPASVWVRSDAQARLPEVEWMFRHFGSLTNRWASLNADPDGDGVPNWQERLAGTDPTKLRLALIRASVIFDANNGLKLRWFGKLGAKYTVEKTTDLSSNTWIEVAANLQGRADIQEFITSFTPQPATYYRVRLQQP